MKKTCLLLFGMLILHAAFTQSTDCDPSVQCFTEKNPYARAMAKMSIPINLNVNKTCTCTMINNEQANGRPLAITAAHSRDTDFDGVISPAEVARLANAFFDFDFGKRRAMVP